MTATIRESTPCARKHYRCDACGFVREEVNRGVFTIAEYRLIVEAKRNGWCIVPKQRYIRQFNTDGGDVWTYRAIPEMHELCLKYDLGME